MLVVDDSADAADSLALLLELEGHEVSTAYSASAALEAAERLQPDVAFIDIGLPQMDGYEVARRLRASDRCRAIRLVALTGYGQPDDRDEARRAGFDHHLVKPADWQSVGAILAEPATSARSAHGQRRVGGQRIATFDGRAQRGKRIVARLKTVALDGSRGRRELGILDDVAEPARVVGAPEVIAPTCRRRRRPRSRGTAADFARVRLSFPSGPRK